MLYLFSFAPSCSSPSSTSLLFPNALRSSQSQSQPTNTFRYFPVYLGGILQGSGNQPPWKLTSRGKYLFDLDGPRSAAHFGKEFRIPKFFPLKSMSVCGFLFCLMVLCCDERRHQRKGKEKDAHADVRLHLSRNAA